MNYELDVPKYSSLWIQPYLLRTYFVDLRRIWGVSTFSLSVWNQREWTSWHHDRMCITQHHESQWKTWWRWFLCGRNILIYIYVNIYIWLLLIFVYSYVKCQSHKFYFTLDVCTSSEDCWIIAVSFERGAPSPIAHGRHGRSEASIQTWPMDMSWSCVTTVTISPATISWPTQRRG